MAAASGAASVGVAASAAASAGAAASGAALAAAGALAAASGAVVADSDSGDEETGRQYYYNVNDPYSIWNTRK